MSAWRPPTVRWCAVVVALAAPLMCASRAALATQPDADAGADAGEVVATAEVEWPGPEPGVLRLDQSLRVLLRVEAPADVRVLEPDRAELAGTSWFVSDLGRELPPAREQLVDLEPSAADADQRPARRERLFRIALDPLLTGELSFTPALRYESASGEGERRTLTLEPIRVTVKALAAAQAGEGESIAPIRPVRAAPDRTDWRLIALLVGGGALAAGVAALALLIAAASRRQRQAAERFVPIDEQALQRLEDLLRSDVLDRRDFDAFFTRCSGVLRWYIERRFGIAAPERTTAEFLAETKHARELSAGDVEQLEDFLTRADLVKFARAAATVDEARDAANAARMFIQRTRPEPTAEASAPADRAAHAEAGS